MSQIARAGPRIQENHQSGLRWVVQQLRPATKAGKGTPGSQLMSCRGRHSVNSVRSGRTAPDLHQARVFRQPEGVAARRPADVAEIARRSFREQRPFRSERRANLQRTPCRNFPGFVAYSSLVTFIFHRGCARDLLSATPVTHLRSPGRLLPDCLVLPAIRVRMSVPTKHFRFVR